jgi:hypothetical protein
MLDGTGDQSATMSMDYSRDGLLTFLKDAAMAGRMNPATARSRRNAASELFTQLTDAEAQDLRKIDVDDLAARCHKLQGATVRPEVLKVYVSRLRKALTDYFNFLEDPEHFVSVGSEQRPTRRRVADGARSHEEQALEQIRLGVTRYRPDVIPIPIRADKVVYLHGLPADLTAGEAGKLVRVIEALVEDTGEQG